MRTTKAEVIGVFKLWVSSIGGRIAESYNDEGAYRLDHAVCYGGWQVERIDNTMGGVSVVFGRLSAYYFVAALRCGMRTLEQARLRHVSHCPRVGASGCAHFTDAGKVKA